MYQIGSTPTARVDALRSTAISTVALARPPRTLLEELGAPSTMVADPAVRRQLEDLEALRLPGHRRAMVRLALEDRELELEAEPGARTLVDDRLDDELLNGLLLILELMP
jgi:hypothetical protein